MPNSPLQSMYGFSLICSIAEVPSSVKILTAAALPIPYSPRNNISERIPVLCFSCREKSSAFDFEIPLSIATLSGSFSITSRVFRQIQIQAFVRLLRLFHGLHRKKGNAESLLYRSDGKAHRPGQRIACRN